MITVAIPIATVIVLILHLTFLIWLISTRHWEPLGLLTFCLIYVPLLLALRSATRQLDVEDRLKDL